MAGGKRWARVELMAMRLSRSKIGLGWELVIETRLEFFCGALLIVPYLPNLPLEDRKTALLPLDQVPAHYSAKIQLFEF